MDLMQSIHPGQILVCTSSYPSSWQPFVQARLSGLVQSKELAAKIACNPTQGHEMLTSDPTCDTSGNVVPQVSGKCAKQPNKIPVLQHSCAPVVCWSWRG